MKRLGWKIVGLISVALGVIGIILPLLPTTPFLILAAFCFDRGSPALHNWLVSHAHLGPIINNWNTHGAVPTSAKAVAVIFMATALTIGFYLDLPLYVLGIQAVIFSAVSIFLVTRPAPPKP